MMLTNLTLKPVAECTRSSTRAHWQSGALQAGRVSQRPRWWLVHWLAAVAMVLMFGVLRLASAQHPTPHPVLMIYRFAQLTRRAVPLFLPVTLMHNPLVALPHTDESEPALFEYLCHYT